MSELIDLLSGIRGDIDYASCNNLISGKVFRSYDVIMVISTLEEHYDIEIDPDEMMPENFDSAEKIYELISSKTGA